MHTFDGSAGCGSIGTMNRIVCRWLDLLGARRTCLPLSDPGTVSGSHTPTDNDEPARNLCPYCQCKVDDEVTRCPECGGHFPALQHRKGDVGWGGIRGLFVVAAFASMAATASLIAGPSHFWKVPLVFSVWWRRFASSCLLVATTDAPIMSLDS